MPHSFTHPKRNEVSTRTSCDTRALGDDKCVEVTGPPILERKIHPDINLLAEELALLFNHEDNQKEVEVMQERSESSVIDLEIAGFVGLEPSTRSRRPYKETHSKDNKRGLNDPQRPASALASNKTARHDNPCHSRHCPPAPNQGLVEPRRPSMPSSMKWPASRKHPSAPTMRGPNEDVKDFEASKFTNQSSLEQSPSSDLCHSQPNSHRRTHVPQTPETKTGSKHPSIPAYGWESAGRVTALPSPHIFGMDTQPSGPEPQWSDYIDFKDKPPPLPPLNHPAFRKRPPSSFRFPSVKHKFPELPGSQEFGVGVDDQDSPVGRQTTHSLPSMRHSRQKKSQIFKYTYKRSNSRSGSNVGVDLSSEPKMRSHSRQHSKTSIETFASSRRSSAEYSAKQVSSIGKGTHGMQDGCWEVEVSKAMVNLALGREEQLVERRHQSQDGHPSSFGCSKARGKNRAGGGGLGLGSPFLLQDTRTDNQADPQSCKDYTSRRHSSIEPPLNFSAFTPHSLRNAVMTNGESILQPTGSSANHTTRKGKERQGAPDIPSPQGSRSRRAGRALSSPSPTNDPPPDPARLDLALAYSTMQSSSTLQPPHVSIISATPEASPSSPTGRRGHHKSTPTIPTPSVLKTPSTPSVIAKSHSSSSGKRKADEAGVGGDKTPPKESRETRTTFAPEPRPHRASATSGVSTHAPSSFNRSKRVRLTDTPEGRGSHRSASRAGSLPTPNDSPPNAKNTGSWSSRGSHAAMSQTSHTYGYHPATSASHASYSQQHRAPSRRSLSQASIPISALISPHAPSIGRLSTFHMRDPRKPNPIQSTPWSLSFPSATQSDTSRWSSQGWVERGGSPLHAWLFFIGFILFPLWWAATFIPIRRTRTLGGTADAEKGVVLDDPQIEHDAKSWRTRCRFMTGVSLLTYVPFIVLVAIYA